MKFYRAEEYQVSCEEQFQRYHREILTLLPDAVIEHIEASEYRLKKSAFVEHVLAQAQPINPSLGSIWNIN
ncbi:hypothetical protein [Moritella sp. 28]|uniref:hypothetical protein n=1 Tax=Moritella sp. 28 TaxID=2746232 RepID=UPI001BA59BC8|nr:hypothetical protein [Moritella sp. 28]QUM85023.1 hypothetical protein HWV02_11205 [Moritella sp. 28]